MKKKAVKGMEGNKLIIACIIQISERNVKLKNQFLHLTNGSNKTYNKWIQILKITMLIKISKMINIKMSKIFKIEIISKIPTLSNKKIIRINSRVKKLAKRFPSCNFSLLTMNYIIT